MSESIRAVERALDVLLCFSSETPELSMTQISEMIGINKSTVHRLLATLQAKRFVERDVATGLYSPGNRLIQLAFLTLEKNDLHEIAAPYMQRLNDMHLETITLSILDDKDMVYIAVLESPQRVKLAAKPGQRLPAFCTASGKVVIAYSPEDVVQLIFEEGFRKYTSSTISTRETMLHILDLVRQRGFAYSEQEYEEGINAVAAPILDKKNRPLAAIAVAGPTYRLPVERMMEIGPTVAAVAKEISKEILYKK
ncbi:MAG: IclR family transcriptional regulator [Anaerolineaceae bacterium]|nr:IclR family transcriptional regulator [Anaerolineaceae bacterium]